MQNLIPVNMYLLHSGGAIDEKTNQQLLGRLLWLQFTDCVVLDEQVRQDGGPYLSSSAGAPFI